MNQSRENCALPFNQIVAFFANPFRVKMSKVLILREVAIMVKLSLPILIFCTKARSFNDGPCGCFSPRSHLLTSPVVTLR